MISESGTLFFLYVCSFFENFLFYLHKNQINERASSICSAVGRPTAVRGDCLISRFVDHEAADIFERKDFTLDDLASDKSAFVVEARANATVCSSGAFIIAVPS